MTEFPSCKFAGRVQRQVQLRFCREPNIGKGTPKSLQQCLSCPFAGTTGTSPPIHTPEQDLNKAVRKSGCGCQKRKEKLNKILPVLKLGDVVEKVTEVTGIKALVERLTQSNE